MDASNHQTRGDSQRLIRQAVRWAADQTDVDYYAIDLATGNTVDLATQIPASGTGQYENPLTSRLQLIGPGGAVVASGAGSLTHTVIATGTYRIEVSSLDGERADYILSIGITAAAEADNAAVAALRAQDVGQAIEPVAAVSEIPGARMNDQNRKAMDRVWALGDDRIKRFRFDSGPRLTVAHHELILAKWGMVDLDDTECFEIGDRSDEFGQSRGDVSSRSLGAAQ
jgi:hypothetical protein